MVFTYARIINKIEDLRKTKAEQNQEKVYPANIEFSCKTEEAKSEKQIVNSQT